MSDYSVLSSGHFMSQFSVRDSLCQTIYIYSVLSSGHFMTDYSVLSSGHFMSDYSLLSSGHFMSNYSVFSSGQFMSCCSVCRGSVISYKQASMGVAVPVTSSQNAARIIRLFLADVVKAR